MILQNTKIHAIFIKSKPLLSYLFFNNKKDVYESYLKTFVKAFWNNVFGLFKLLRSVGWTHDFGG